MGFNGDFMVFYGEFILSLWDLMGYTLGIQSHCDMMMISGLSPITLPSWDCDYPQVIGSIG